MKKKLAALIASAAISLPILAENYMRIKQSNGEIVKVKVDNISEVSFKDSINPLLGPDVMEASKLPFSYTVLSNNTVEIESCTPYYFYDKNNNLQISELIIPKKVLLDGKVYDIIGIGHEAFEGYKGYGTIVIPSSISYIDYYAFKKSDFTSIKIESGVTKIKYGAFQQSKNLVKVELPSTIEELPEGAFFECINLTDIVLPDGLKEIGFRAFSGCTALKSINIPDGLTTIDGYAFCDCVNLADLDIPSSVTLIKYGAFDNCSSMTPGLVITENGTACNGWIGKKSDCIDIEIPEGVTKIGERAFYYARSLKSVKLPSTLTSIEMHAFEYCKELSSIVLPAGLTEINESAFESSGLTSIDIPMGITKIDINCFSDCTDLETATIPSSVTVFEFGAFSYCTKLDITIDNSEDNVKVVDDALDDCKSVTYTK